MGNLRKNYHRFLLKNRNKGFPNLMLWICIGNAIVFVVDYLFNQPLVGLLYFDSRLIMQGQVWRLFSYIFTFASSAGSILGPIFGAIISILFYYWVGRILETAFGTLRFNLYYLCGILLTDFYMLLLFWIFKFETVADANYLNLSMFLAAATLLPEEKVYIYFIIPVKLKWLAWLDLALCLIGTVRTLIECAEMFSFLPTFYCVGIVMLSLYGWVSILNYFIFFGKGVKNLLPTFAKKPKATKTQQQFRKTQQQANPDWAKNYRSANGTRPYRHKCTVCGRTDTDSPGLEFRYCSRCNGYHCYCLDHINNHTHVE